MNKTELRKKYLQKRSLLSKQEYSDLNQDLVRNFFQSIDLSQVYNLHLFLPIADKHEVNTFPIREKIDNDYPQIQLITSISNFTTHHLLSCQLHRGAYLKPNCWGIPEPETVIPFPDHKIDMVLVPLLAFDLKGNRVGYGKGFYDRFFTKCKPEVVKVGLSLFEAEEQIDDVFGGDVRLDFCVSPQKVYRFL